MSLVRCCYIVAVLLVATVSVASGVTECTKSEAAGEACRDCTFNWWYLQETCSDVSYSAFCSCQTGTEECFNEDGSCTFVPDGSGACDPVFDECPEIPW